MKNREPIIDVLLVEDEETLALIIKDTLEGQGFAENGEEGIEKFFGQKPDVVVADVMMPRMDGFEMVRRIRRKDKQTPVLFLTARSATSDVVEGFELGGNDYLKKPFGMQELIVRIKALLGRASNYSAPEKQTSVTEFEIRNRQVPLQRHHPTPLLPRKRDRTFLPRKRNLAPPLRKPERSDPDARHPD